MRVADRIAEAPQYLRQDHARIAARAAQSAPADRIGDVVNAVRLDVVEFFDCRLQREGHIRPRISVRNGKHIERINGRTVQIQ